VRGRDGWGGRAFMVVKGEDWEAVGWRILSAVCVVLL